MTVLSLLGLGRFWLTFFHICARNERPCLSAHPGAFAMLVSGLETLLSMASFVLARLSFRAGAELSKLNERGRHLFFSGRPCSSWLGDL